MTFVQLLKALAVFGSLLLLFAYPAIAAEHTIAEDGLDASNSQIPEEMRKAIRVGGDLWREHGSYNTIVTFRVGDGPEWELVPVNSGGLEYVGMLKSSQKASEFAKTVAGMVSATNKPDLVPLDRITVSPQNPKSKERIDMEYTTANPSVFDVYGNFVTRLDLPGGYKADCNFNGLPALSWGSCGAYIIGFDAGTYSLKETVDVFNQVSESNESNNVYTRALVIRKPDVDLVVEDVLTEPETPDDKSTFRIVYHVRNRGSDDIREQFKSTLYIDGKEITRFEHGSGAPSGQLQEMSLTGNTLPKGTHKIKIVVDEENAIDEVAEGNNQKEVEVVVSHVKVYDMAVTGIYTLPAEVNDKVTFSVNYVIKNDGEDFVASDEFEGKLFREGVEKQTCRMPAVEEGLYQGGTYTCSYQNQQWAAGKYSVKAVVGFWGGNDADSSNNELSKLIEIASSCPIPDGSSVECECNSNSDCPADYYCQFKAGFDACVQTSCQNECDSAGFFCSDNDVYECSNFDSDNCFEKRLADICSPSEVCSAEESSCQLMAAPVRVYVEDSGSDAITVYKQHGDLVEVTILSDALQNAQFSQPEQFNLVKGICSGTVGLGVGEEKCLFEIGEDAPLGDSYFSVNGKTAKVVVIDNPKTIVVTNKEKLYERFEKDKSGVDILLRQTFQFAHDERNTIVYYLDREIANHPFDKLKDYVESFLSPSMTNNSYSTAAARLVSEKCGKCKNTIILGDDFVVPFYRHNVPNEKGFLWWKDIEISTIHSDLPYISVSASQFSDLSYLFQSGEVALIIPSYMSKDDEDLTDLKAALVETFHSFTLKQNEECSQIHFSARTQTFPHYCKGECYNPEGCEVGNKNLTGVNDIIVFNSEEVACDSFSELQGKTLIVLGDEESNQAMNCFPWTTNSEYPVLSLQRNVWDGEKAAILLKFPEEYRAFGMLILTDVLYQGEVYTYIQSGSDFELIPSLNELMEVAPFSTCNDWANVGDNYLEITVVSTSDLLFCVLDAPTLGKGSLLAFVAKGGKGATTAAKVAKEYNSIYKLGKAANFEAEIAKILKKSPTSLPYISLRVKKFGQGGAGTAFDTFLEKSIPEVAAMPADDFAHFMKGMEKLAGKPPIIDFSRYSAETMRNVGKSFDTITAKHGTDIAELTIKGIKKDVIDVKNAELPEKLAQIIKGYGTANPFYAGEQTLVKIFKAPGKETIIGTEKVDNILVLRKGNGLLEGKNAWGFDHGMKHADQFEEVFGVKDPESISKIVQEVVESGEKGVSTDPGVKELLEKTVTYNGKTSLVRVPYVVKETNYGAMPGDIATFFPVK